MEQRIDGHKIIRVMNMDGTLAGYMRMDGGVSGGHVEETPMPLPPEWAESGQSGATCTRAKIYDANGKVVREECRVKLP